MHCNTFTFFTALHTQLVCVSTAACACGFMCIAGVSFGVPEGNMMRISRALARLVGE